MHQYARPPKRKNNSRPRHLLFWVLAGALVVSAVFTIYLVFTSLVDSVGSLFQRENTPEEPEVVEVIPEEEVEPVIEEEFDDLNAPLQTTNGPRTQRWDGKSRINILLLGVDDRTANTDDGPPRSDTIILLTIDPESETAGMLSLPRDLWVEMPDSGGEYNKINTAYLWGEAEGRPGGGAGLAMETVEIFLDVDIPYYVQINFFTFIRLVDEVGGVKIDVPERIMVDLRRGNVKHLEPGIQTLPGDITLAYVRARNTPGGDFDRSQRQQQVLRGLLARVTDFEMLPTLIRRAPSIYKEIQGGVNTNLTPGQLFTLARLATNIPKENITSLAITQTHATAGFSWNGMYILTPIPEQIELLKKKLFSTEPSPVAANPTATTINLPTEEPPQVAENDSPENQAASAAEQENLEFQPVIDNSADQATIGIHNGTYKSGLASETATYFENHDLKVTEIDNADTPYAHTTIIDFSGKPNTLTTLIGLLDLPTIKLYNQFNPNSKFDVLVILGDDWADDNPLP